MLKIIFIRHGATAGNLEKRYIGRTDEPLTEGGKRVLSLAKYPKADVVCISPMLRCRQSAEIIYPKQIYIVVNDLRECDFGKFEGRNYIEMKDDLNYQAWIDSNGKLPFPDGESNENFKKRCVAAFAAITEQYINNDITLAFVVHGGTIMSVLEYYSGTASSFYDWQVENGNGYETVFTAGKKFNMVKKLW